MKKKIDKNNSEKKKQNKSLTKNHVEKHCNNPQCFKEKNLILNQLNSKTKSTKTIMKKQTKKRNKTKKEDNFWKKKQKRRKK
jgi:hypothetical protein